MSVVVEAMFCVICTDGDREEAGLWGSLSCVLYIASLVPVSVYFITTRIAAYSHPTRELTGFSDIDRYENNVFCLSSRMMKWIEADPQGDMILPWTV
ncbi:hypothetical protein BaRGS_00033515 [Batillaria attramentaria]|uniref:Uncharacterized protein n=1 Tax=Batillaria attramentaria TaxID=370345 RepID=A0ABD0JJU7_9CAEN